MPRGSGPSRTLSTTSTSTGPRRRLHRDVIARAAALAERLAITLSDRSLLEQALVHRSFTNDHPGDGYLSNQRLEFLGDAVLALVFSDALFRHHPNDDEGLLTARRAALVSTAGLARLADRIGLGDFIMLGEGAERANERRRPSVLEAAFEAVVGAVYVDRGFEATRSWLVELAAPELGARPPLVSLKSPKSLLLEASQARTGRPPTYRLLSAVGPDHAKRYVVEALIGEEVLGTGSGSNRRQAESQAAAAALERLRTA